jgi:antirestriction protein ArdC
MDRSSIYSAVTAKILRELEAGTVPWEKPWSIAGGYPRSISTGKLYRGINVLILMTEGRADPRWGTYKAISDAGGQVRKKEKGTTVILWKPARSREHLNEAGELERSGYLLLRTFTVFNATQADGLPELPGAEDREFTPLEAAERLCAGYVWEHGGESDRGGQRGPLVEHGYDHAAYDMKRDVVHMPDWKAFAESEAYYSTLFHELVHSTGYETRLNRLEPALFGTDPYAKEELVAEIGASFLAGMAGLESAGGQRTAAYLANWMQRLTDDPGLIVNAAAQAQKAVDMIAGTFDREPELEAVA